MSPRVACTSWCLCLPHADWCRERSLSILIWLWYITLMMGVFKGEWKVRSWGGVSMPARGCAINQSYISDMLTWPMYIYWGGGCLQGIFIGLPNSPIDGLVLENVTITDPNGHTPWTMVGWNCTQAVNVVTKDVSPPWPTGTCTRPTAHVQASPSPEAATAAVAEPSRKQNTPSERTATYQVPALLPTSKLKLD